MFIEPEEESRIASDAAAKLDRAAATQRSAIRRQATVRPGRHNHSRENGEHVRTSNGRGYESRSLELGMAQLETEMARLRRIRMRQRRGGGPERDGEAQFRDAMELVRSSRENFREGSDMEIEDSENENEGVERRVMLPRVARESNLRFEVNSRNGSVSPPRRGMVTPPLSSGSGDREQRDGLLDEPDNLTPGFAPARGPRGQRQDDIPTPPPETWEASYPPLRRVGHISPRRPRVDGLGDRRRSVSPEGEEETWVNMLTTMDDRRTTSQDTSFASSNGRARESQNTTTSFGEIGHVDDGCDLDLPSGITESDVAEIRAQHRRLRRTEPDGPIMTGEQGLRQHRQRHRGLRVGDRDRSNTVGIEVFQNILERMQRQEEVPDEWWAAVGMTPFP